MTSTSATTTGIALVRQLCIVTTLAMLIGATTADPCRAASDCDVTVLKVKNVSIEKDRIIVRAEASVGMVIITPELPADGKSVQFTGRHSTWIRMKADDATFTVLPPYDRTDHPPWSEMTTQAAQALKAGKEIGRIGFYRPEITIRHNRIHAIVGRAYIYPKREPATPAATEAEAEDDQLPSDDSDATAKPPAKKAKSVSTRLTGRFVFDGDPPEPKKIGDLYQLAPMLFPNLADAPFNTLIVGNDKGIANVFVYVRSTDIPFDKSSSPTEPADVSAVKGRFSPHAMAMRSGQELQLRNPSKQPINFCSRFVINDGFNPLIPAGKEFRRRLKSEPIPVRFNCHIYPWMHCWVLIKDHPYAAVTDTSGRFTIDNLPEGEWEFQVWHEQVGNLTTSAWPKGRFTRRIDSGTNDLGTIRIRPAEITSSDGQLDETL